MRVDPVSHSGSCMLVVNAARVSFDRESKSIDRKDISLLNFLAREKHYLPFRHPQITLRVHAPIFVLRQIDKHQVGFSTSEISRRYVTRGIEFYQGMEWRKQSQHIKQGSRDPHPATHALDECYSKAMRFAKECYENAISQGASYEQARAMLPQAMMTTQIKTGSLLGWWQMIQARQHETAQRETQMLAKLIEDQVKPLYPYAYQALNGDWR